jgi:hypothetical protein
MLHIGADRRRVKLTSIWCRLLLGIAVDGNGRDCTMRCESPWHRGERFAIEAQLLAKSLDDVRYDVATFAEHLLDDEEGGEVPLFRPCLILRPETRISDGFGDGPPSKRSGLQASIPGFPTSVTSLKPLWVLTCTVGSPPACSHTSTSTSDRHELGNFPCRPNGCSDICNGVTACVG